MFPRSRSTAFAMTSAARSTWSAVVNLPTVSRTVQMPTSSGTPMAFNTYDACSVPLPCRPAASTSSACANLRAEGVIAAALSDFAEAGAGAACATAAEREVRIRHEVRI